MTRRRAFSMIELLAVLVILSLLGSFIAVSVSGALHQRDLDDVRKSVIHIDRLLRWHARDLGRETVLEIDIDTQTLTVLWPTEPSAFRDETAIVAQLHLPEEVELERLWINGSARDRGAGSAMRVRCTAEGLAESYALGIKDMNGMTLHLLFAGLTGEVVEMEDEHEVEAMFVALRRLHTD